MKKIKLTGISFFLMIFLVCKVFSMDDLPPQEECGSFSDFFYEEYKPYLEAAPTVREKLDMMRNLYDEREPVYLYVERAVFDQIRNGGEEVTLRDRRMIVDHYGYRGMNTEKAFWFQEFISHVRSNPTVENFLEIAEWCLTERGAFVQNLEERETQHSIANMLGLQISKSLKFYFTHNQNHNVYQSELNRCNGLVRMFCTKMGLSENHPLNHLIGSEILHPSCLDSFIQNPGGYGFKIKQLSYISFIALGLTNLDQPNNISIEEIDQILTPAASDITNRDAVYHKLGLRL